jgi:hypothetical protein
MHIRVVRQSDAEAITDIYRPAVTDTVISFEYEPPDPAEISQRIESVTARTPWLVCEGRGTVLGYAYATRYRERPGLWHDTGWFERGLAPHTIAPAPPKALFRIYRYRYTASSARGGRKLFQGTSFTMMSAPQRS